MTIKLDRDFNSFSKEDSNHIVHEIASALQIAPTALHVKNIRAGSVIMTLELDDTAQAEKLFLLIKLGKLKQQGIIDAKLKELTSQATPQPNRKLWNICDEAKSALKKGKTGEALQILDNNLTLISESYHNDLFVLYSDHTRLNKEINLAMIDDNTARIHRNKITYAVLDLVDNIKKKAASNLST